MDNIRSFDLIINIDLENDSENKIISVFSKALEEKGFKLSDGTVTLRNNRLSSIRVVDKYSGEELEMYAFSKTTGSKTFISVKIV